MKKIILLFLLWIPSIVFATGDKNIIGLGDSITTGYGVDNGYFKQVCEKLEKTEKNIVCTNLAIDGLTSTELLLLLDDVNMQNKIKRANKIFMSIGGNDFLMDISKNLNIYITGFGSDSAKKTGEKLTYNVKKIYEKINTINDKIEIYMVPLYNPYFEIFSKNKGLLNVFDEIKKEYIEISNTYSNVYISSDLAKKLENKSYLNASIHNIDPHPNQEGHNLIGHNILDVKKKEEEKKRSYNIHIIFCFIVFLIILFLFKKVFRKK